MFRRSDLVTGLSPGARDSDRGLSTTRRPRQQCVSQVWFSDRGFALETVTGVYPPRRPRQQYVAQVRFSNRSLARRSSQWQGSLPGANLLGPRQQGFITPLLRQPEARKDEGRNMRLPHKLARWLPPCPGRRWRGADPIVALIWREQEADMTFSQAFKRIQSSLSDSKIRTRFEGTAGGPAWQSWKWVFLFCFSFCFVFSCIFFFFLVVGISCEQEFITSLGICTCCLFW